MWRVRMKAVCVSEIPWTSVDSGSHGFGPRLGEILEVTDVEIGPDGQYLRFIEYYVAPNGNPQAYWALGFRPLTSQEETIEALKAIDKDTPIEPTPNGPPVRIKEFSELRDDIEEFLQEYLNTAGE